MTLLHIIAGLLGLASGAVALYARKGATLHRRSGMVFVYTMLLMSASGALLAALKVERISVVAGLLTFYLVSTALLTVRRPLRGFSWLDTGALLVGLAAGLLGLALGMVSLGNANGEIDGLPGVMGFIFGTVALLGVIGDLRMMRARGVQGKLRLVRHLWRMCLALWIATASFFLGQADEFPASLRNPALLATPVVAVLLVMLYWLVRVRYRVMQPDWRDGRKLFGAQLDHNKFGGNP
ncbi:MAG: hypothetical protein DYG89_19375 [Caldilinea sp. CFX5]|nr:hypothetical protein [Caldilinea sp. CFX5]